MIRNHNKLYYIRNPQFCSLDAKLKTKFIHYFKLYSMLDRIMLKNKLKKLFYFIYK